MTNTAEHPAQKYLNLREKNLAFFKQYYPGIYEYFSGYQMQHAKLDILPEKNEIDLIVDGLHLYGGKSTAYAKKEVATFLSAYDYGSAIHSFRPLARNAYDNPRFFAQSVRRLYEYYYDLNVPFEGYKIPEFIPLMVFMGVGIGRQISIMTQIRDIHHSIVFERDMDRFAASFYVVDWQATCQPFLDDEARSFTFVLTPGSQDESQLYASVWNHLIQLCPIFPVTTLFYNHMADPVHDRIANKVNSDLYVHLFSFGNVDDELNQLNNALHNFRQNVPLLRAPKAKEFDIPVAIVGSGPSLDERIEDLKSIRDHVIIISSGTALRALWKHGIKPDIHVELESDYNTYATQNLMEDKAFVKSIKLIGAVQLNPLLVRMFDEARLFFKDDGPLGYWFNASKEHVVANSTPTCTNAALALVFHFKFPQVYLFGMDYGFPDKNRHHAAGSVYYTEGFNKDNLEFGYTDLIKMPSSCGGEIYTTSFLYTSKRRIENLLYGRDAVIFNCSNGVVLENSTWLEQSKVANSLPKESCSKSQAVLSFFESDDEVVAIKSFDLLGHENSKKILDLERMVNDWLKACDDVSIRDLFTRLCSRFIDYFRSLEQIDKGFNFFVRGSVWHYLLAGYTHVYSLGDENLRRGYFKFWRESFLGFLKALSINHKRVYENVLAEDSVEMIFKSIQHPLVSEVSWQYQGYSIIDEQIHLEAQRWEFRGFCHRDGKLRPC